MASDAAVGGKGRVEGRGGVALESCKPFTMGCRDGHTDLKRKVIIGEERRDWGALDEDRGWH